MKKRTQNEPYLATYFHQKGQRLGLPIAGNFELTARCNFNCPMCYVHLTQEEVSRKGRELTAAQWIDLAKQAKDLGMLFVLLTGGEPFLREDFFEIYEAMNRMGLIVSINSNGFLLKGEIAERLIENPPSRINVSLYGGCNETYKRMCGREAYDQVFQNILYLKRNGIDVRLNLSITPYNCQDIEKIYQIAIENEIPVRASAYMYPPVRREGVNPESRLTAEESARYSVEWDLLRFTKEEFITRTRNMELKLDIDSDECEKIENRQGKGIGCRAGSTSFWLTWDGQMRPCGMMPGPSAYPLKNGFETAWQEIRRETAQICMPAKCGSCDKKEICGSCAAVCMAETGAFDRVPEYMCRRIEEMVRLSLEKSRQIYQMENISE